MPGRARRAPRRRSTEARGGSSCPDNMVGCRNQTSRSSIDKHELIAVEEHAYGVGHTVLCNVFGNQLDLARTGRAAKNQFAGGADALLQIRGGLLNSRRNMLALTDDEP